jgi:hypothetical protein
MHVDEEVLDGILLGIEHFEVLFSLNFLEFIYDLPDRLLIHRPHGSVLVGCRRPVILIGHLHQTYLTLQVALQVNLSMIKFCKVLVKPLVQKTGLILSGHVPDHSLDQAVCLLLKQYVEDRP